MGNPGCVRSRAWIWVFSSTHSTMAWSGGFRYSPTTSVSFSRNRASRDNLKRLTRCGFKLWLRQILLTVDLLTPCASAICRQLHWVMPLGLVDSVAWTIALIFSDEWVALRPRPAATSHKPSGP